MERFFKINYQNLKSIYHDLCKDDKVEFEAVDFEKFQQFLEIDFFDWVKENFNYYQINKINKFLDSRSCRE